jgi:hypothetical protein
MNSVMAATAAGWKGTSSSVAWWRARSLCIGPRPAAARFLSFAAGGDLGRPVGRLGFAVSPRFGQMPRG